MSILPVLCVGLFAIGVLDAASLPAAPKNCSLNEEFNSCANALCRALLCKQQGIPVACPGVSRCDEECICVFGTMRNNEGKCVPENECPGAKTCPKNEEWSVCPEILCGHQHCDKKKELTPCPEVTGDLSDCKKGCVCSHGYLRNESGQCVPEEEC